MGCQASRARALFSLKSRCTFQYSHASFPPRNHTSTTAKERACWEFGDQAMLRMMTHWTLSVGNTLTIRSGSRKGKRKATAFSGYPRTLDPHLSSHGLDHVLANVEPQPTAWDRHRDITFETSKRRKEVGDRSPEESLDRYL